MRKLPEKVGSKYKFITVSAKRCEMLQKGAKPKIDTDNMTKFTTVAMEEVLDNLIDFRMIEENSEEGPVEEVVLSSATDELDAALEAEKAEKPAAKAEASEEEDEQPTE